MREGTRVLVTGAGGFIGSHLCEQLIGTGAAVRGLVRYRSQGRLGLLQYVDPSVSSAIEIVAGDLRDFDTVLCAASGCHVIIHLGALISVPYSYERPREVAEINMLGALNVLLAGRDVGARRVVHISSSEVYGTAVTPQVREDHPLQGQSPYAASKIGADKLAQSFHLSYGVPVVTLRPFNAYGPRQSGRAIIPTIVAQALRGRVVRLGALDATRDFTFVTDVVRGIMAGASIAGIEGQEINLGSDTEVSVGDLVGRVATILGRELEPRVEERRLRPPRSEVTRLRADNTHARQRLGWQPTVGLDEGLRRVVGWIEAHPELYEPRRYEV